MPALLKKLECVCDFSSSLLLFEVGNYRDILQSITLGKDVFGPLIILLTFIHSTYNATVNILSWVSKG